MKTLPLIALLTFAASVANAQLDHILAPLPVGELTPARDQPAAFPGDAAAQAPAQQQQPPLAQHTVTADELIDQLQKQLVSYFGIKGDLRLNFVGDWRPLTLPSKDFTLSITAYPPEGVTDSFVLRFKIVAAGQQAGEWQLGLRAQLWQSVWVSQGRLDRGQALDASLLKVEKIDVLREVKTFLPADTNIDGYDIAQGIGPGQPISKQDVVERPVIHRGDVVEVIAVQGLLNIHMKALALEDGGPNALIKMRNLDSNKDFNAQIIDENEVKINF